MKSSFYITTPIYYVTDKPHIGHLYTTIAADIQARYHRLMGDDVWFLTGTDEHGEKIEKKAKELNEMPQALADRVVQRYHECWKRYEITFDDFIRTSEDRHKKVVFEYIKRLMNTGDIYLDHYEGWYCVPDESFWTDTQVIDGKCPDCGRPVERLKEESYFFRMSSYVGKLLEHIEKNPDFIQPESRKNEVVGFLKQEVRDISISRTTIQWGISMPPDAKATKSHKVYVWFDALTNYLSALRVLDDDQKYLQFWPESIHVVGKDILRFHAVYWPTFLMALGLPLPNKIVAHGWLTESNRKISKSLGNAVDPMELANQVGVDGMRYFLFREFVFGLDGEYTPQAMYQRINSDLANDYGNCVNRVCAMLMKYFGQVGIDPASSLQEPSELRGIINPAIADFHSELRSFHFNKALEQAWSIVSGVNRFIENSAPWTLAKSKDTADLKKLRDVLLHCHEALRIVSVLALPIIPETARRALNRLGSENVLLEKAPLKNLTWGSRSGEFALVPGPALFPRLEWKTE